ncbi:MAG: DUF485 domain-containing protein [Cytophagaceae bacterium]|nr:DUF485 domain-containing protein [Cytophagaceae bacterium]MDW8455603.1 DUF485 domain-containing protein [Cytophagaceae bacterium]
MINEYQSDVKKIISKRNLISYTLAGLMIMVYFTFIMLIAYSKQVLAIRVVGNLPLGIPLGVGIIVFSWLLTGVYIWWANQKYDKMVREIKSQLEKNNQ